MANRDSTTFEPASTIGQPMHENFSWLNDNVKNDPNAKFAELVKTVARGTATITGIIRKEACDAEIFDSGNHRIRPLLASDDLEALTGLMLVSLEMLSDAAEDRIEYLETAVLEGAKK